MSTVEVRERAEAYGRRVLALLGQPGPALSVGTAPCEGRAGEQADDGRRYLQAVGQVPLAPGSHVAALSRLRDDLVAQGFELTAFRVFVSEGDEDPDGPEGKAAGDEATLTVRNPADGFQLVLTSTRPAVMLAVQVFSPCYLPTD